MASAKTLIRTGVSLANRFLNRPLIPYSIPAVPQIPEVISPPRFLPSLFTPQFQKTAPSHYSELQNNVDPPSDISSAGFLYPSGLPYLPFFLPDGDESSSSEPMLLFPKRTYQPSNIRRKRTHGFFARKSTKGGEGLLLGELRRVDLESLHSFTASFLLMS